jgi:hypothetical protein
MICESLSDRMPEVAKGTEAWDPEEAEHLAWCQDCQAEWAVIAPIALASAAAADPEVDLDRVAGAVLARLGTTGGVLSLKRFSAARRWYRPLAGLAAAAALVLAFASLRPDPSAESVAAREPTAIPELDALFESELELLLASLTPVADEIELLPSGIPRLGDLTDVELELLLETVEG